MPPNSLCKSPGLELRHAKDVKTLDYDESKFEMLGCTLLTAEAHCDR